jgi:tRNA-specific 2-thiouridylase
VAERPESQDICFVPGGDRSHLFSGETAVPGQIVDRAGTILGTHRGLVHYTVGQRRGLGVAAAEPLYVLALDPEHNRLLVGPRRELGVRHLRCDQLVLHETLPPASGVEAGLTARVRYRHRGAPVAAWHHRGDVLAIELGQPAEGVAPGQYLVLYRGELVAGGGRIVATDAVVPAWPGG